MYLVRMTEGQAILDQLNKIDRKISAQPRAVGKLRLTARSGGQLGTLFQAGSSRLVFPRTRKPGRLDAVIVNTAGGVTGGDRFSLHARVEACADLALTTQTAERAYRAQPGEVGRVTTRIRVAEGATLSWLPQETILFDGCALRRQLDVTLEPDARATLVEPVIFGRMAMGETQINGSLSDRIAVHRGDVPIYLDAWCLSGDITAELDHPAIANGARAMASVVHIAPEAARLKDRIRSSLPPTAGVSMLADDILVVRLLAETGFAMRQVLLPILEQLTGNSLPLCWRL